MPRPDGVTRFASVPNLPRDGDEPVFAEPWQAEAFALTVRLYETGCFTWAEWADTLAAVLREARQRGEPDDGLHYYDHWLVALERLVITKRLLIASDIERRKAAWTDAYLSTPHGKPVALPHGVA